MADEPVDLDQKLAHWASYRQTTHSTTKTRSVSTSKHGQTRFKEEITMTERTEVSEAAVCTLADLAGLPLAEGREALLAPQLSDWLTAANELSRKMSKPQYQTIVPATIFTHPNVQEESE